MIYDIVCVSQLAVVDYCYSPLCVLDVPAGLDETAEDTYLPIIGSGPASNLAASMPGPSAVVANEPKYAIAKFNIPVLMI